MINAKIIQLTMFWAKG